MVSLVESDVDRASPGSVWLCQPSVSFLCFAFFHPLVSSFIVPQAVDSLSSMILASDSGKHVQARCESQGVSPRWVSLRLGGLEEGEPPGQVSLRVVCTHP